MAGAVRALSSHIPMWPKFKSWHGYLNFYVSWVCCCFSPLLREVFSLGSLVFPSLQKSTYTNSNSTRRQVDEEPLCGCATLTSNRYLKLVMWLDARWMYWEPLISLNGQRWEVVCSLTPNPRHTPGGVLLNLISNVSNMLAKTMQIKLADNE